MQIFNVHFGLANNSSSDHKIVLLPKNHHVADDSCEGEYGWDDFTLTSPKAKLNYLGVMLRDQLRKSLPSNVYNLIIANWLNVEVRDDDYVDHQSVLCLPCAYGTKIPDERFVKELRDYFLQDNLAILGGNDNSPDTHPLGDGAFELPIPRDYAYSHYVCRYDDKYNYWTLFNQKDGTKIRLRIGQDKDIPKRSSTPELADIHITNFCNQNCSFCYQNSDTKGMHAEYWQICDLMRQLAQMQVFEVALGGGEPTSHPNFVQILEGFRRAGIVPNFTTRNLSWLYDPSLTSKIMANCGSFAYTIHDYSDIKKLLTLLDYNQIDHDKARVQIVLGTMDRYTLKTMLKSADGVGVTLLGYKPVGRGANFTPANYDYWLDIVQECHPYNLSVDTALAAAYEKEILAADVPAWMFSVKEGQYSCYIDLVGMRMGPSSYCKEEEMHSIQCPKNNNRLVDTKKLLSIFRKF
jgi:hypothetical protein